MSERLGVRRQKTFHFLLYIWILVAIYTLLLAYSVNFDFNNLINGGDTQLLLNPKLFIEKSLFIWEDTITGIALPIPGYWFFYAFPLYVLDLIFRNIALSSFIYFVILFSLPSISMFLLSIRITRNTGISFFISIFYGLNLYTAIQFHTPTVHILYLFGITPLLILIFTKIEASNGHKRLLYFLLYTIFFLPIVRTINMFMLYLILIPLVVFIITYGIKIPVKRFLKQTVLSSVIIFLIASPILATFFLNLQHLTEQPITQEYTRSAIWVEMTNKLIDSIRFVRTFAWKSPYQETTGILAYGFAEHYKENPFLLLLSFYPILSVTLFLLLFHANINRLNKSRVIGLLVLAILSLFLINPSLTPIGKFLPKYLIRSVWTYFSIPFILSFSLILVFLLKHNSTKKILLILLSIHLIYISPAVLICGRLINQAWIIRIPQEYYKTAEFLNRQHENFRILSLPLTKHFAGYTPYEWGYTGPDVLYTLTDKTLIDKHHNVIAPVEYLELINRIEKSTSKNLIEYSKLLNVKYILLRNDVDLRHPYVKVYQSPSLYKDLLENEYSSQENWDLEKTFGKLDLYKISDEYFLPHIYASTYD